MRELWFESHGTKLFAVEVGEGAPVILLHGGLANHLSCRGFAGPLDARFRVVTPDLRGAGRSHFAGRLTWELLADDIAALVRTLGVSRAVIGGVSFGAGAAVKVALRHPALVDKLLVLNPAFGGDELGLLPMQKVAMDTMDAAGRRAPAEGIEVILPLFDALPVEIRERVRAVARTYDPASVATTTAFMASGLQPFERGDQLAAIRVPTLLIPGADPYHPPEVTDVFRRYVKDCVVVEAALPAYGEVITRFLDDSSPPPSA